MLFSYEHVPHSMDKMQKFIDFIFFEIWFKATSRRKFDLELFNGSPELKEVMTTFFYGDTKGGDLFYTRIEAIYGHFAKLSKSQRKRMRNWYWANNLIERACCNDQAVRPIRYNQMSGFDPKLIAILKDFFMSLYSKSLIGLAALRKKIGDIDDHYNQFTTVNGALKCPFCGIADVLGPYHENREAYDHYLPKSIYPFNSINFKNLAPACHHCNSTYKTTKDPNFVPKDRLGEGARRKAFYPYTSQRNRVEVTVGIDANASVDKLTPADITLGFGLADFDEEISTWNEIYSIDERYKAKLCDDDARAWLEDFLLLNRKYGITPNEHLEDVDESCEKDPNANKNFLKKAFLHGCAKIGALEAIAVHAPGN